MSLHSNSLFHFTKKEHLLNILRNNFIPHYCKERFSIPGVGFDYWIPMVSFCDIPLSQIKEHIAEYGKYAIGLNREWVNKSKLNPVLYYKESSCFFEKYYKLLESMRKKAVGWTTQTQITFLEDYCDAKYLFSYFKPYIGYDFKTQKEKIFYDEREWRYVPGNLPDDSYMIPDGDERLQPMQKRVEQDKLYFEPKDISYIVIENEDERLEFFKKLREIKSKYSPHDVEILITKIISSEQILNDM